MPTRWNLDHQPVVLNWQERAVMPGESREFTDEQIAAGLTGLWGEEDPRAGLADEILFKRLRDASRPELDSEARSLGIDPDALVNKQAVADAIKEALAPQGDDTGGDDPDPDDTTEPAESGDKE